MTRPVAGLVVAGLMVLAASGAAFGSEADLRAGLAHLRAGAQAEAERDLVKYREAEPDADVRRVVDRLLPLLRRPQSEDVREYIATTLEETVRMKARTRTVQPRADYLSRMFPVFP